MKKPRLKIQPEFTTKAIVIKAMTKLKDNGLYLDSRELSRTVSGVKDRDIVIDIVGEWLEIEK